MMFLRSRMENPMLSSLLFERGIWIALPTEYHEDEIG